MDSRIADDLAENVGHPRMSVRAPFIQSKTRQVGGVCGYQNTLNWSVWRHKYHFHQRTKNTWHKQFGMQNTQTTRVRDAKLIASTGNTVVDYTPSKKYAQINLKDNKLKMGYSYTEA